MKPRCESCRSRKFVMDLSRRRSDLCRDWAIHGHGLEWIGYVWYVSFHVIPQYVSVKQFSKRPAQVLLTYPDPAKPCWNGPLHWATWLVTGNLAVCIMQRSKRCIFQFHAAMNSAWLVCHPFDSISMHSCIHQPKISKDEESWRWKLIVYWANRT